MFIMLVNSLGVKRRPERQNVKREAEIELRLLSTFGFYSEICICNAKTDLYVIFNLKC